MRQRREVANERNIIRQVISVRNWSSIPLRTVEPIPQLSHPSGEDLGYLYTNSPTVSG